MQEIIDFYTATGVEANRLFDEETQLERVRTQELILRHVPHARAKIVDIGGGMGFYSFWLAEQGHEVHLVDLVPMHVDHVLARNCQVAAPLAAASLGDARSLAMAPDSFDVALMLGPLYHLTQREDRMEALSEARRVLRPGGLLIAVSISQFASLLGGFRWGDIGRPEFLDIMEGDLEHSRHINTTGDYSFFTTSYFQHPSELRDEVTEAGFAVSDLYAVESFGRYIPDFDALWADEAKRALLLRMVRRVESEPSLMGVTCHNMVVGHLPR